MSDAAALGDRSENADYIYGKRRLREIDRRVRFLSKRLDDVTVVTEAPSDPSRCFFGAYVTLEHMNLDQADVLYTSNGPSDPAPCAAPLSVGMVINASGVQLLDNNVYESSHRGVLIGINYASSTPVTGMDLG